MAVKDDITANHARSSSDDPKRSRRKGHTSLRGSLGPQGPIYS